MSGIVGGNLGRGSGLIKAGAIDDDSVTLAKMAGLARGTLIIGDASGDPAALAVGGADEVLTHDGTDFDWAAAAGGDLSFGGDTFGADKTIGSNDTYSLSLETDGTERLKLHSDGRGLSEFTAKVWINFIGVYTISIRDSHNVSSITDNGGGDFTVTFANSLADANYSAVATVFQPAVGDFMDVDAMVNAVGSVRIYTGYVIGLDSSMSPHDVSTCCILIFGG